jgi:anti-sigma regulatory factor (Ser/Thr protein kinase)
MEEERIDLQLPADPAAAKIARNAMKQYGVNPEADVVVTELVANAVMHGLPPITLRILRTDERVRIEVQDARPDVGTGRDDSIGLRLVEAFATQWGIRHHDDDGKTVFADVAA